MMNEESQKKMFGAIKADILESFDEGLGENRMKLMSILSDVQFMVEEGMDEEARQALNRAKMILVERF